MSGNISSNENKEIEMVFCTVDISSNKDFLIFLESKLDIDIGYYYWKKYIASAFWSNISTPINLIITLLTAVTTAQTASSNIISEKASINLSIAALIITSLNTFFRPHTKMTSSTELMKKWIELGNDFEELYYTEHKYNTKSDTIIEKYKELQLRANTLKESEGPDTMNWLTDLIHFISKKTCIKKYQRWLDTNKQIMKDSYTTDK
jgi:hypothetical protein